MDRTEWPSLGSDESILGAAFFESLERPGRPDPDFALVGSDRGFTALIGRRGRWPARAEPGSGNETDDGPAAEILHGLLCHARSHPGRFHRRPLPPDIRSGGEFLALATNESRVMALILDEGEGPLDHFLRIVSRIPVGGRLGRDEFYAAARALRVLAGAEAVVLVLRDGAGDELRVAAGLPQVARTLESDLDFDRVRRIPGAAWRGHSARVPDAGVLLRRRAEAISNRPATVVRLGDSEPESAEAAGIILAPEGNTVDARSLALTEAICAAALSVHVRGRIAASETRYRTFTENLMGIAYQATIGGSPHFMHGQVEAISGHPPERFLSGDVSWSEVVHPEDAEIIADANRKLLDSPGYRSDIQYRILRPDGSVRWVRDIGIAVRSGDEENQVLINGVIHDITEAWAAREALRSGQRILEDILESTLAGYWDFDLARKTQYLSPGLKAMFGYDADELADTPETWRRLIAPEDLPRVMERFRRHIESGGREPFYNEIRCRHRDGSMVWIICAGRVVEWGPGGEPLRMVGCHVDITRQKEAERSLDEERARYERLTTHAREAIIQLDVDTGAVVYANPAAEAIYGYSREEFLRDPDLPARMVHPRDRMERQKLLDSMRNGDALPREVTLTWIARDGREVIMEHVFIPVIENGGRVNYVETIGRDVTRQRRYERRLEYLSMNDQLTGLSNRARFEDEMHRLEVSRGSEYPITILAADIDGLKLVNDTMGHERGDRLIRAAADILRKTLRRSDLLARIGGDEFAAILTRTAEAETLRISSRLRELLRRYNEQNPDLPLSLSAGMATADRPGRPLEETLRMADGLMYRDKLHHRASSKSALVDALLAMLVARNYAGEETADRTAQLALGIGERMELPIHQLSDLDVLARVHDLGKVGIPDDILFKKGNLNEVERNVIQSHPEIGFRVASAVPDLASVADLILKHHERWDGSGYPLGLRGEEIPAPCRVLAVAEAYLGMTSERDGGEAPDPREALESLRRRAGTAFDPAVVEALAQLVAEGRA